MQRLFLIYLLCGVLSGCTAAQMQSMQIRKVSGDAATELKACIATVYHNPEYTPAAQHLPSPENNFQPTMAQLSDDTRPTKSESSILVRSYEDIMPCRQAFLQKIQPIVPTVALEFSEGWNQQDQILMKLIKRKITWGKANQQRQQVSLATQKNIIAAANQIDAGLAASHQAELAQRIQRQQAQAALMQAQAAQMQASRSHSQTSHTSCTNYTGMELNCTTSDY